MLAACVICWGVRVTKRNVEEGLSSGHAGDGVGESQVGTIGLDLATMLEDSGMDIGVKVTVRSGRLRVSWGRCRSLGANIGRCELAWVDAGHKSSLLSLGDVLGHGLGQRDDHLQFGTEVTIASFLEDEFRGCVMVPDDCAVLHAVVVAV